MCVLSDCVVRIETGLWVIRFHYVAYFQNAVKYLTTVEWTTRPQYIWAWPAVGTGCWELAVHSSQFTV